ncbi:MAG: nucleoside deaminase [Fibrobacter sp.]|nr:nucleoside deaminase [Fibrobacter sp.]
MQQALRQAELAFDAGEVPIGCVIVKDAKVIAKGYNQIEMLKDATAHAEILAIGSASSAVENWRLNDCTMYVTLEPCPMCAGAILNSRISRLVYGSKDTRFGGCGGTIDVLSNNALNREIIVESGVLADECLGLIRLFFQKMRMKKDSLDEKNS